MQLPSIEQQTAIIGLITAIGTLLGTILAFFLAREKRLTRIETQLEGLKENIEGLRKGITRQLIRIEDDIDGIALRTGTDRAVAIATKQEKESEDDVDSQ